MSEFGLVVSFPDQSESFVIGFEAGMIWQRLENGERQLTTTIHTSNAEVVARMCEAAGLLVVVTATEVDGWSEATISGKPAPRLRLIKGGLALAAQSGEK